MKYVSAYLPPHLYPPIFHLPVSPRREVFGKTERRGRLTENKVRDVQSAKARPFRGGELGPGAVFEDTDSRREGCLEGEEQEAEVEHWIFYCNSSTVDPG